MFVSDERVAVTVDGQNIIYIRARLGAKAKALLQDELVRITGKEGDSEPLMEMHIGAYQLALLHANVTDWAGPDFGNVPCVGHNIDRLDPSTELYDKVLGEIAARNPIRKDDELKNSGVPGSSASKESTKSK